VGDLGREVLNRDERMQQYGGAKNRLYEAKASSARVCIPTPIGQRLDYLRHIERPGPRLAVLLPPGRVRT
jgi:hypothetical protein